MPATAEACRTLNDVLEIVDRLSLDEQKELLLIVRNRMAARRRDELVASVERARREFAEGKYRVSTPEEIVREALS